MPVCLRPVQQQDGSVLLALDSQATELTACAYVVESGADLGMSLVSFSAQDGGLLSGVIVSCWAVAWLVRSIIPIIKGSENA